MYPVALYGSLPEIAYLAPRGSFRVRAAVEEEPIPRSDRRRRTAPIEDERGVATPMSDQTN
jgi:hypothetical protein